MPWGDNKQIADKNQEMTIQEPAPLRIRTQELTTRVYDSCKVSKCKRLHVGAKRGTLGRRVRTTLLRVQFKFSFNVIFVLGLLSGRDNCFTGNGISAIPSASRSRLRRREGEASRQLSNRCDV